MKLKAYIYHKRSEKYKDCQDRFGIDVNNKRIAVSDGMTQSIFPDRWAQILVDAFLESGTIPQDIKPYQYLWQTFLSNEISRRESEGKDPWRLKNFELEKKGAGATLCGFTWTSKEWKCECLGDSCLIEISKDYQLRFFTSQVGGFDNHPDYFDSFLKGKGEPVKVYGNFDNVRALLLVTDPFSELFQRYELNKDFIKERLDEILGLSDHESFVNIVESWRDNYNMHDDDSTLVIIQDFYSDEICCLHIDDLKLLKEIDEELEIPETIISQDSCEIEKSSEKTLNSREKVRKACEELFEEINPSSKGKAQQYLINLVKPILDSFKK